MTTLSHESVIWDSHYSVYWGDGYNRIDLLEVTGSKECRCEIGFRSNDGQTNCQACPLHSVSGVRNDYYFYSDVPNYWLGGMGDGRNALAYNTKNSDICKCDIGYYGIGGLPPVCTCNHYFIFYI